MVYCKSILFSIYIILSVVSAARTDLWDNVDNVLYNDANNKNSGKEVDSPLYYRLIALKQLIDELPRWSDESFDKRNAPTAYWGRKRAAPAAYWGKREAPTAFWGKRSPNFPNIKRNAPTAYWG
ncbi:hypothetical protein SNEBB_006749 [Seison nebaliae]|nr:hypothetical protein SNEBB_006749 [Seison nebaliae]